MERRGQRKGGGGKKGKNRANNRREKFGQVAMPEEIRANFSLLALVNSFPRKNLRILGKQCFVRRNNAPRFVSNYLSKETNSTEGIKGSKWKKKETTKWDYC